MSCKGVLEVQPSPHTELFRCGQTEKPPNGPHSRKGPPGLRQAGTGVPRDLTRRCDEKNVVFGGLEGWPVGENHAVRAPRGALVIAGRLEACVRLGPLQIMARDGRLNHDLPQRKPSPPSRAIMFDSCGLWLAQL